MSKPKRINFELINEEHEAYRVLAKVRKFHNETKDADISLAWHKALKPDVDGRLVLGKCIKVSDLHKEFFKCDFIIVLNKEVWEDPEFTMEKKEALVDHECCHMAVTEDDDGPKVDERDRKVWRTRKHSIEEFHEIIQRHGTYKRDLELFAELLMKRRKTPLFNEREERENVDGPSTLASASAMRRTSVQ